MKAAHHLILMTGIASGLVFGQEPPRPPGPPSPPEGSAVPVPNTPRPRPEGDRPRPDGVRPPREFRGPGQESDHSRPQGARPQRSGEDPPFPEEHARPFPPSREGPREGPGPRRGNQGRPVEKLQPYIGVITRNAPPELTAQIRQTEGLGLVVEDVLPDSPAQVAGLQRNDLLLRFDDQLLAHPLQLEALIRRIGKDKEAALIVLRGGAEEKVTVKIGEKMLPERRPGPRPGGNPENSDRQFPPPPHRGQNEPERSPGPSKEFTGSNGEGSNIRYSPERARVVRRDSEGLYELSHAEGDQTFIVRDTAGNVTWRGPVGTPDERQAIPSEWRPKLKMLEDARIPSHRPTETHPQRPVQ